MTDRLSKAKEFAVSKWSEVSTNLATQRRIRELRKRISELIQTRDSLMAEMGHKVYTLYQRDKVRNADLRALCQRVDEINSSIDALNRQIEELTKPRSQGDLAEADLEDETALDEEPSEDEETEEAAEIEAEEGTSADLQESEPSDESDAAPQDEQQ